MDRIEAASAVLGCVLVMGFSSGCSTTKPPALDPEIKRFAETACVSYQHGQIERAAELYLKALQRARLTDDETEIIRNAYNLALCRMEQGRPGEARALLFQAEVLAGAKGVVTARILLAEAEAARLQGLAPEIDSLAREALAAGPDREGRLQARLLQGESALLAGRTPNALEHYEAAQSDVKASTAPILRARLDDMAVRLVRAGALEGTVAVLQLNRAGWLKQAGQYRGMALALEAAAEGYEQESKWVEAFDCFIRSAQSLIASGERELAASVLAKASRVAGKTGNSRDKALVEGLVETLKQGDGGRQ